MPWIPLGAVRFTLGDRPIQEAVDLYLDDLVDVEVPDPDAYDVLYWNATDSRWENASVLDVIEEFDMEAEAGAPYWVPGQEESTFWPAAGGAEFEVKLPLGLVPGNLLIALVYSGSFADPLVTLEGFTARGDLCHNGVDLAIWYRVVTGLEEESATATAAFGASDHAVTVLEFADVLDPSTNLFSYVGQGFDNPTPPAGFNFSAITPASGTAWLYLCVAQTFSWNAEVETWPTGYEYMHYNHHYDEEPGGDADLHLFIAGKRAITTPEDAGSMVFGAMVQCAYGVIALPGSLIANYADNTIMAWDAYTEHWKPQEWFELDLAHVDHVHSGEGGSILLDLDELDDVVITTPADNEVLAYDSGSVTWINQTAAEAGLAADTHDHDADYSDIAHVHALDDLSDVSATDPGNHMALAWDAGENAWIDLALDLGELGNVSDAAPDNGDVLTWDAVAAEWEPAAPAGGAMALDDLTDVNAAAPADLQLLTWDADPGEWIAADAPAAGPHALDSHTDVNAAAPNDLDVLTWDADPGEWIAAAPGGGAHALAAGQTDVTVTDVADNEVLAYDTGTSEWINQTAAEAGLATDAHNHDAAYADIAHDHDAAYMAIDAALADLSDVDAAAPNADDVLTWDGDSWGPAAAAGGGTQEMTLIYTVPGSLEVSNGVVKFMLPVAVTIVSCRALVGTAPVGASAIVDVHMDGTTIYTTQGNRPTIATGDTDSGSWSAPDVTAFAANSYFTVDIDQIGSTTPGANLTLMIRCTRSV